MKRKIRKPKKRSAYLKIGLFVVFSALVVLLTVAALYAVNYKPDVGAEPVSPYDDATFSKIYGMLDDDGNSQETAPETKYERIEIEDHTRKEGMYNFLILGRDRIALNTDVIMLVSLDTVNDTATIMQIPRDTYFEVNGTSYKLNALYASFVNQAKRGKSSDPYSDGMVGFTEAIQQNLYIKIDYWAVVNLAGFRNIVNMLGGVEVTVPFDMDYDDPDQDLHIHLKAGYQTLNGDQAEQFIRFRSNYVQADIGRINAQKIFMSAMLRKMKNCITVKTVATVAKTMLDYVLSSISVKDCAYFAKEALDLDLSNIRMFTMPGADARADGNAGAWYFVMNRTDMLALINEYFNVYNSQVTEKAFDSQLAFTDEDRPHLNKIYRAEGTIGDPAAYGSSASGINSESIDIPLLN